MSPDYSEIVAERAAATPQTASAPTRQQIAAFMRESTRGAVILKELLDSPAWNVFNSTLAGHLQSAEAERALLREQIEAGQVVGDERERADLRLQFLRGVIQTLTLAMDLPKQLIAQHERLDTLANVVPAGSGSAETRTEGTTS